jgi:predicted enzyme related to lactoylglutathione lyase
MKPAGDSASSVARLPRGYDRHWTPVHLDFVVADVSAAVERAVTFGAKQEGNIRSFVWGRLAVLSDPFGHGFCLLQFIGGGYDAVA